LRKGYSSPLRFGAAFSVLSRNDDKIRC